MAISVIWDQVQGSELMLAVREAGYAVRCGRVFGLTNAVTTPPEALTAAVLAAGGVPAVHPDPLLSGFPLRYVIVRGDSQTTGMIWAHYAPQNFSGSPVERLAIEVGGSNRFEETERLWETGEPYFVMNPAYPATGKITFPTGFQANDPRCSLLSLPEERVTKVVTLYGLFAEVPDNLEDIENCVNESPWPAPTAGVTRMGLGSRPIGHWLAAPPQVRWSQRDGLYQCSLTLASKGKLSGEDWSTYKFAVDPTTGRFLMPDQDLMTTLAGQTYEYGIRNNTGGVLKVGQRHLADYSSILTPLISNTPLRPDSPIGNLEGI